MFCKRGHLLRAGNEFNFARSGRGENMLVQESVNSVAQVGTVLVIAAIVYLLAGKNRGGFFSFVGLKAPTVRAMGAAVAAALILAPLGLLLFHFTSLGEAGAADNTVAGEIRANGFNGETIAVIAVVAFFKTALSEEIFFRGLLAKRLIGWLGFAVGNAVHAVIFGAVHLLVFVFPGGPEFTLFAGAGFFLYPALMGWIMAFLNERIGYGSIAPSWLVHGVGNAAAYPVLAFL